jgi:hypothetical protein
MGDRKRRNRFLPGVVRRVEWLASTPFHVEDGWRGDSSEWAGESCADQLGLVFPAERVRSLKGSL